MSPDRERPPGDRPRGERPQYTLYRSRPRLLSRRGEPELGAPGGLRRERDGVPGGGARPRGPWTRRRVVKYVALTLAGWLALSLVLFLASAQIERGKSSDAARRALDTGGPMPFASNTILVLGSDARPKGTHESGANVVGQPSRSDTIMLIRTGGGASQRLSIPRDTVVDIPGHGPDKINAAYAIGGPALTLDTVKRYLGIEINHLVEVNFANFPQFIDALGGVNVTTGCVHAQLDGGDQGGGTTLRLNAGTNHLDGRHALALARVRKNACNRGEDDRDRARRQQEILRGIKGRLVSPFTFVRLPWVSWTAPKAIRTDMAGPTLLALFTAIELSPSPPPRVLATSPTVLGSSSALAASEEDRQAAVRRFLGR